MKILLLIGKILGFGVLGILGIVLLLLFYALFIPIFYDVDGIYQEQKGCNIRIFDVCRIFCFRFAKTDEDDIIDLRVLWMHLLGDEEEEKVEDTKEPKEVFTEEEVKALAEEFFEDETTEESEPLSSTESKPAPPKKTKQKQKKTKQESTKESSNDTLATLRKVLDDEEAKDGIYFLLHELGRFLRMLAPKKCRFQGEFYTGDPALTGEITGFIATIPWLQPKKGNYFLPDFSKENFYLYGTIGIAGYIQLYRIVGMGIRIFFHKNVRKLYAYFKDND